MEAYVDDMIIKLTKGFAHTNDLGVAYEIMKQHNIRLVRYPAARGQITNSKPSEQVFFP